MFFNSIDFGIFLPIVFTIYWLLRKANIKVQNGLLVIASYFFYGCWDWRFLALILFSTIVDYLVGLGLSKQEDKTKRKLLLWLSIIVNLGFLGFFKYFNFFLDSFTSAFSFFGSEISGSSLDIILPVGISFYTFQTLSYSIDVYRKKLQPTTDILAFSAFVSFFPQLVAGPIERATNLLPQFMEKRSFNYARAVDGMRQILWGLFKKIVIADNCAAYANEIFNNSANYSGSTLVMGVLFFSFQIYGDFSGYSDIAIGVSRLFGFDLKRNFAFPYFSRNIGEFWRRWHISLSTWFRDYLYIPLGGSRGSTWVKIRNTFIIFIVSGFWHGSNWTFIAWGFLHALFFLPLILTKGNRKHLDVVSAGKHFPSFKNVALMLLTFMMTSFAWIFFRAESLDHAFSYILNIHSWSLFSMPEVLPKTLIVILVVFMIVEWLGREQEFAIEKLGINWKWPFRYAMYYGLILVMVLFGGEVQQFIYFQF
ncbi:MAG: alginate O-acetyltransferase complex protein AlgI [Parvicellaceae bacterium]|jgi:alginate O-acetyltransferase complex protein AlgI